MEYVKGYVLSNVKSVCNIFAESILRNMRLSIERTYSDHVSVLHLLTLTLYAKKRQDN